MTERERIIRGRKRQLYFFVFVIYALDQPRLCRDDPSTMRLDEFDKFDLKRLVTSPSWCESFGSELGEVRMISV